MMNNIRRSFLYLLLEISRNFLQSQIRRAIFFGLKVITSGIVQFSALGININIFFRQFSWMWNYDIAESDVFVVIGVMGNTASDTNQKNVIDFLKSSQ